MALTWLVEAERKQSISASEGGWWRRLIWSLRHWWKSAPMVRCVEGEPFGMKGMLERYFGRGWRAPNKSVSLGT